MSRSTSKKAAPPSAARRGPAAAARARATAAAEPNAAPLLDDLLSRDEDEDDEDDGGIEVLVVRSRSDALADPCDHACDGADWAAGDEIEIGGSGGHLLMVERDWEADGGASDQIVDWIDEWFS